jgi:thiamine biosynthesis lipoprotein
LKSVTRTSPALGTQVSITALHANQQTASRAIDDAFAEIERVEELMSVYRPHSQLSRLNRDGRLSDADPQLLDVLRYAVELSRRTAGAFDVTVQPLWKVYAAADKAGRLPEAAELAAARRLVDWRGIKLGDGEVQLTRAGAQITLNGVAQGYAADRAMAALVRGGVRHAIVDSGEIGALGGKPSDGDRWAAPWKVGIQHPRHEDAYISLAALADRCLATSGDYATRFGADYEYNHLFDPRTGRSPTELASVSVAARTSMQADALSTAVFVLGPERGLELIDDTPGADALLVLKSGRVLATPGFPVAHDGEGEQAEDRSHG